MLHNKNKAVNIGILEISPQNKAILEFFFGSIGKSLYKEVKIEAASAFIIDYDYIGAKESWGKIYKETKKPGIIISIHEVNLPSTVWIAKPLTAKALTDASEKLSNFIAENIAENQVEKDSISRTKVVEIAETIDLTKNTAEIRTETLEFNKTQSKNKVPKEKEVALAGADTVAYEITEPVKSTEPKENKATKNNSDTAALDELSITTSQTESTIKEGSNEIDQLLASLISGRGSKDEAKPSEEIALPQAINIKIDESSPQIVKNNEESNLEAHNNTEEHIKSGSLNLDGIFDVTDGTIIEEQSLEIELIELDNPSEETTDEATETASDFLETDTSSTAIEHKIEGTAFGVLIDAIDTEDFTEINENNENNEDHIEQTIEDALNEPEQDSSINPADIVTSAPMESTKTAENELQRLLEEIRKEADSNQLFTEIENDESEDENAFMNPDQQKFNTDAEKRWYLTCGDLDEMMSNADAKKNYFNPEEHLLATFNQVVEKSKSTKEVMRLKIGQTIIVVDALSDTVYCDNSIMEDGYAKLCYKPINKNRVKIHSLDASEVRMILNKQEKNPERLHSIESFIWTTSMLTARGRLPQGTNIENHLGLKHWPNLTRLESFPHSIQIAAVFKKRTGSLLEFTQWLEHIPQSSIFTFYNGVLALDLLELDKEKLKTIKGDSENSNNKSRGFFSRLLRRITK